MKKTTKVILAISLALIVVGGGLSVMAVALSGGDIGVLWSPEGGLTHSPAAASGKYQEDTVAVGAFSAVDVTTSYGDVEFQPSADGWRVEYKLPATLSAPEIAVKDGTLYIENDASMNGVTLFGIPLFQGDLLSRTYFRIYYPEGAELSALTIDNRMGEIEVRDLTVTGAVDLNADMGSVTLDAVTAGDVTLSVAMGEVKATSLTADYLTADANMGGVDVSGTLAGLDISADMGEVDLSGCLTGQMTVDCAMGSVKVDLELTRAEVYLELDTGMGDTKVNGKAYDASDGGNEDGSNVLTVNCAMGEIDITCK